MRPLWYEFPQDAASWTVEGQHLVGDSLLVAPVLTKVCKLIFQDSCFVKEFFRVAPLSMCTSLESSSTGMITGPTRGLRSLAVTMLRRHMKRWIGLPLNPNKKSSKKRLQSLPQGASVPKGREYCAQEGEDQAELGADAQ